MDTFRAIATISNFAARHRRFAASINLNSDYEGCDLIFPEFGRRIYRAPVGGAIVFSCGALHEVTPVTRGKRYAFVPFFYAEEDAALSKANNIYLRDGEARYTAEHDMLFPSFARRGWCQMRSMLHEKRRRGVVTLQRQECQAVEVTRSTPGNQPCASSPRS